MDNHGHSLVEININYSIEIDLVLLRFVYRSRPLSNQDFQTISLLLVKVIVDHASFSKWLYYVYHRRIAVCTVVT